MRSAARLTSPENGPGRRVAIHVPTATRANAMATSAMPNHRGGGSARRIAAITGNAVDNGKRMAAASRSDESRDRRAMLRR